MSTQLDSAITAPPIIGDKPNILIVRAPYYTAIVDGLRNGAVSLLEQAGCMYEILDVAGALELASAVRLALPGKRNFDGFVVLGCVVRGETDHYEHVCREAMSGLTWVTLNFGLCLGNGLLTVATEAQAVARAGADGHNKGGEAAAACLVQINAARWLEAV